MYRASDISVVPWELTHRAIFALSTGFPTMGVAVLNPGYPASTPHASSEKEGQKLAACGRGLRWEDSGETQEVRLQKPTQEVRLQKHICQKWELSFPIIL
jgi:hypothetical protein